MRRFLAVLIITIIGICPAHAELNLSSPQPVVYSFSKLFITRKTPPAAPATDNPTAAQPVPAMAQPPLIVEIQVRDAIHFYRQDGWFNMSQLPDGQGILLVFSDLVQDPIVTTSNYAPLDILMINTEGTITEIVPSLILANLQEDIYPQKPVLAFLLLAGGSCEKMGIRPGDEVKYSLFRKPPPVITETTPQAPPEPQEIKPFPESAATHIGEKPPAESNNAPAANTLKMRRAPTGQPAAKPAGTQP